MILILILCWWLNLLLIWIHIIYNLLISLLLCLIKVLTCLILINLWILLLIVLIVRGLLLIINILIRGKFLKVQFKITFILNLLILLHSIWLWMRILKTINFLYFITDLLFLVIILRNEWWFSLCLIQNVFWI